MKIEVVKSRYGDIEPYAGRKMARATGNSIRWAIFTDGEYSGYNYTTKKQADTVAAYATEIGYNGAGDLDTGYAKWQGEK